MTEDTEQQKVCTKCATSKPLSSYSKKNNKYLRSECKQCRSAYNSQYYQRRKAIKKAVKAVTE